MFEIFHFALRPEGRLMLGQSESIDSFSRLFSTTDKVQRIFSRRPVTRQSLVFLPPASRPLPLSRVEPITYFPPEVEEANAAPPTGAQRVASADELHRAVLELYAPPSVLINAEHDILHLSEGAGRFLRISGGTPTASLLRLVHPELRIELRTALYAAESEGVDQVRVGRVTLTSGAPPRFVRLRVRRAAGGEALRGYLLVLFEEQSDPEEAESGDSPDTRRRRPRPRCSRRTRRGWRCSLKTKSRVCSSSFGR